MDSDDSSHTEQFHNLFNKMNGRSLLFFKIVDCAFMRVQIHMRI